MSWLEIIHLRSSGEPLDALSRSIRDSISKGESNGVVTIYRHDGLETDVAIHLHHQRSSHGPSELGLHLAAALRVFGLVEHTMWEEFK